MGVKIFVKMVLFLGLCSGIGLFVMVLFTLFLLEFVGSTSMRSCRIIVVS